MHHAPDEPGAEQDGGPGRQAFQFARGRGGGAGAAGARPLPADSESRFRRFRSARSSDAPW